MPGAPLPILHIRWARWAALAVLLMAGDWLACQALQHRMRGEYAAWVQTITSQGWSVRTDAVAESGFPAGATLTITGLDLSGGHAMLPGGLDWRADRVVLSLGLLHFWRLTVEPQGQQVVRVAGLRTITCYADSLVASVPLGRGRADSIALVAEGLTAGLMQSRDRLDVHIDHLALGLQASREGAARIAAQATIEARGVALPDIGRWPLGARVRVASVVLDLASPALSGVAASDQARAWRDWGGALTVRDLVLLWGPLDLRAQARMGLDDDLQPAGSGRAVIGGWAQTVDALGAGGTLPEGMVQTVKMVMGLMARPADGGGDALTVPFSLKHSTLSAGKIPLIKLRNFNWGSV
jgi:hypothetical protein